MQTKLCKINNFTNIIPPKARFEGYSNPHYLYDLGYTTLSLVEDEGRLGADTDCAALQLADAIGIDDSVGADYGPLSFGDVDLTGFAVGVEHDDDVVPCIAAGIVLQAEGDEAGGCRQELEVFAYKLGTTEAEGGMGLAQGDEVFVVAEHLRVAL